MSDADINSAFGIITCGRPSIAIQRLALSKILDQLFGFSLFKDHSAAVPVAAAQRWVTRVAENTTPTPDERLSLFPIINSLRPHCAEQIGFIGITTPSWTYIRSLVLSYVTLDGGDFVGTLDE